MMLIKNTKKSLRKASMYLSIKDLNPQRRRKRIEEESQLSPS